MTSAFLKTTVFGIAWMLLVALVTLAVGLAWFPPPIEQPFRYNHQPHVDLGCEFCHSGVETQERAHLPEITLCVDCHDRAPIEDPAQVAAWNRVVEDQHIEWRPLTRVDNHVYFSHRRHVALGEIECVTCHGDMGAQTAPPPRALKPVSMELCMDCHRRENVSNDCTECHR